MDNIDPAIGENYSVNNALISLYDALYCAWIRWRTIWWRASKLCQMPVNLPSLKENARFHDSSAVNADAVAPGWQRMLRLQGPPTYRWTGVADENSIGKLDDFTVKFTLNHLAPFLNTLAHFYIVNPAIVEANRVMMMGKHTWPRMPPVPDPLSRVVGRTNNATSLLQ